MPTNLRDTIARQFLYETGMFDSPAEIGANPEHRLVVIAYKAADRILTFLRDDDRLALSRALLHGHPTHGVYERPEVALASDGFTPEQIADMEREHRSKHD